MRTLIALLLMLLTIAPPLAAQDDDSPPEYRLRVPSAEAYLQAVPHIMEIGNAEVALTQNGLARNYALFDITTTEIYHRFPELWREDPIILYEAYRTFYTNNEYWTERDIWGKAIVLSWLNHNHIDLSSTDQLHFLEFEVTGEPRDFNADGQPEWILDITSEFYQQKLVVLETNEEYRLIDSPLPWFGCCFAYWSYLSGFMEEQLFEDITGDGILEWVLAVGGVGGGHQNYGYLIVLQWQDGSLVDIAPSSDHYPKDLSYSAPAGGGGAPLFPYGVQVDYKHTDGNGALEIIIEQEQDDNWGCTWDRRRTYSRTGEQYELIDDGRTYDDVQGCEVRAAEEAMWADDYGKAIQHYERALTLQPSDKYFFGDSVEIIRYATARLALAYTLVGQHEDASAVISTLHLREQDSPALTDLITVVKENLGNALEMCFAAYDVFDFDCPAGTDACIGSPLNTIVGRTLENSGAAVQSFLNSYPPPAAAGCYLAEPLQNQLSSTPFNTNLPVPAQLEALDLPIIEAIHFDLNHDKVEEWLVWFDLPVPALFFHADADDSFYQLSYASIPYQTKYYGPNATATNNPYYDPAALFVTRMHPDTEQELLIVALNRRYNGYYYSCPPQKAEGGSTSVSSPRVVFTLWRLDAGSLLVQEELPFCRDATLQEVFGAQDSRLPTEIKAWSPSREDTLTVTPATYRWNDEQNAYLVTNLEPLFEVQGDYSTIIASVRGDILSNDFLKANQTIQTGLNELELAEAEKNSLIYLRALALEALNRPDEALAEYVTIYESAPDSAWGQLAALHLERVEP